MTTHVSARIAWHMNGWNGHICHNPSHNTYCVGRYSYPGEMIRERRDLLWEQANAGLGCADLDRIPPCIYSINAFGQNNLTSFADPPDFFRDDSRTRHWDLPPATVCVWPYEEMYYAEGVEKPGGGFDYDRRLEAAKAYFNDITADQSLIFYYANYSNPFSEEDQRRYVLVGLSRVKQLGEILFYDNCSEETKQRYGGGFVWQRNVTSHYPDEGFRIPYHLYQDQPEILQDILLVPNNPRTCKYATRRISDDDALDLVEQFLGVAIRLRELGDNSENWDERIRWLQRLIAELWQCRGLYPGLTKILDVLDFQDAIPYFKQAVLNEQEQTAKDAVFNLLAGNLANLPGLTLSDVAIKKVRRQWLLRADDERHLLQDILPRFDIYADQIQRIVSEKRTDYSIDATLAEIAANPYILCESYVGDGPDDLIPFNKIDHGMFPSPELGGASWADVDDWRRLRALCVDKLKAESQHTFLSTAQVIHDINHRLSYQPEWKRHQFTERYLIVDEAELSQALTFRTEDGVRYIYLKQLYEDEREVEKQLRFLAQGPDITFRAPVTAVYWADLLRKTDSDLARQSLEQYEAAIQGQVAVCQKVFVRPVAVLAGGAGTGKTFLISAMIQSIERAHGRGTSFQLLAPTGKAADRIREATGKPAATIHSFLAQRGWLNDNLTFKRRGGQRETGTATFIIDEASMLDLELAAALFRAIDWTTVQRLILVGDPNQLPPIGRGRVFADIIEWFTETQEQSIGLLEINMRQMENRLRNRGAGILDLAALYVRQQDESPEAQAEAEAMLRRVQEAGDVDRDLRIHYWQNAEDLAEQLVERIIADMEADTGQAFNPTKPWELWRAAFKGEGDSQRPEYQQVISPYRSELFGVDHLNLVLQENSKGRKPDHHRMIDGIALFDKVLQFRNRGRSQPLWAYNTETRQTEAVDVFNGELGFVKPHPFDKRWSWSEYRIERFQVVFSRKLNRWVGYGKQLGKKPNGRYIPNEKVEENLELAYAISVHKAQGSEFERVYFVVPKHKAALLSPELFYTGLTRAKRHCTLFIEEDISALVTLRRPEKSHLARINASLFRFRPVPPALQEMGWYEEGKIHETLTEFMVRSKSEVIIANMLAERDITYHYERPLFAPDGTFYLPDFTITWRGQTYFWEHLGRLDLPKYRNHWETKQVWYEQFFPGQLLTTTEGGDITTQANTLIAKIFR